MLSIKDSKTVLTQMGLNDEQLEQYEKFITPFIDFHKYVMEENDISSEAAEKITDAFVKQYVKDYIDNHDISTNENINDLQLAAEAMRSFALIQNYDPKKADELVNSTHIIMKIFENVFNK